MRSKPREREQVRIQVVGNAVICHNHVISGGHVHLRSKSVVFGRNRSGPQNRTSLGMSVEKDKDLSENYVDEFARVSRDRTSDQCVLIRERN